MKKICAFAPATIANVNVGFDVLGIALSTIGDTVELTANGTQENKVTAIENGPGLPLEADKNCCTAVIGKMQEKLNEFVGVDVKIHKGFASGSGLGSSSASSAAAAFAYNELVGQPFSKEELVMFAAHGEFIACGTAHLDNVAPAILGGLVLVQDTEKGKIISLPLPEELHAVSFFPKIKIDTSGSRSILKTNVPMPTVAKQVSAMGGFVASLYQNDLQLLQACLKDWLVEPMRKMLIPKFEELKAVALEQGALTFGISGSGPSLFALAPSEEVASNIKNALEEAYKSTGIETLCFIEKLSNQGGAKVV